MSAELDRDPTPRPRQQTPARRPPISLPGTAHRSAVDHAAPNPRETADDVTENRVVESEVPDRTAATGPTDRARNRAAEALMPRQRLLVVIGLTLSTAFLYFIALAPLGLGQLAFLAIAPCAWLVIDARRLSPVAYFAIYVCGCLLWSSLYLVETDTGISSLGAAAPTIAYVAAYYPAFIWLGRLGRRRLQIPLYLWLPCVWCGLEWVRSNLLGGFSLGLLAHAVVDSRKVLQITDLAGSYGLGALMVACGASLTELIWLTLRLRHLERRIPKPAVDDDAGQQSDAFASAYQLAQHNMSLLGRPRTEKSRARESMEMAVRRTRDRTRDYHLSLATMSVLVVAGIVLFSNWYGRERISETRNWKLFESNLFVLSPLGGPETATRLRQAVEENKEGMIVTAVDQPIDLSALEEMERGFVVTAPAVGDDGQTSWQTIARLPGRVDQTLALGPDSRFESLRRVWRVPAGTPQAFAVESPGLPIRLLPTVASAATVEQTVNDSLRHFHDQGKLVDAVLLTIEPSVWDGSAWPRLTTRSVMAAAVSNRCPVVAVVPNRFLSVANGDGNLWWSSTETSAAYGDDVSGSGQSVTGTFQVMSMIDPRSSWFVKYGDYPAIACFLICLLLLVLLLFEWIQSILTSRQPTAASAK